MAALVLARMPPAGASTGPEDTCAGHSDGVTCDGQGNKKVEGGKEDTTVDGWQVVLCKLLQAG